MKMKCIYSFCSLLLIGCAQKQADSPHEATAATVTGASIVASVSEPVESGEIASLRAEAKARHLHFHIHCNADDTGFDAEAWPDTIDYNSPFIEDGGVPAWNVWGASTQEQAAVQLMKAIRKHTNWVPLHKPQNKKGHCPPEIRG